MKQSIVKSESLEYVLNAYREWLDIQGYAAVTVYSFPNYVREFVQYVETQDVSQVQQITPEHFKTFCGQLKTRSNVRRGGALSNSYLNKYIDALTKFAEYLRKSARLDLPYIQLKRHEPNTKGIDVVSVEEMKAIFAAASEHPALPLFEAIAARDKALLTVLYSCGLRRNECYHLDLSDINFDRLVLHVRKGKGCKERFVPFNKAGAEILQSYIYDYRPYFHRSNELNALFVSAKGNRMGTLNASLRLKALIARTELIELKEKDVTMHTLRHSIATHLLDAGMSLEKISRFLGHSSLESTQIYTHLLKQSANLSI